jgi:hypothetical protein
MNIFLREKYFNVGSAFFFLLCIGGSVYTINAFGKSISQLGWSDTILLSLATYRLARMIVYEKVFSLFRYFIGKKISSPLGMSLNYLITCPWCTGVWVALFLFDIYFLVPYGNILVYLLAIAGIATPLVQLSIYLTRLTDDENPGNVNESK